MHLRSSCYHPAGYVPVNFQKITSTRVASRNSNDWLRKRQVLRCVLSCKKKHLEPVSLCKFRVFFGPVSVDRLTLCHSLWIQLCLLRKRQLGWTLPNLRAVFLCEAVLANQRSQRKVSIRSLLFVPWKNPQQDPPFGSCESLCNLADLDDL